MGLYDLHKFMFDMHTNAAVRQTFLADAEAVYRRYHLSQEELTALRERDLYRLSKMGASVFLLAPFAQLLGYPLKELSELLRAGADAERQQQPRTG